MIIYVYFTDYLQLVYTRTRARLLGGRRSNRYTNSRLRRKCWGHSGVLDWPRGLLIIINKIAFIVIPSNTTTFSFRKSKMPAREFEKKFRILDRRPVIWFAFQNSIFCWIGHIELNLMLSGVHSTLFHSSTEYAAANLRCAPGE
jgi:hypothetical protein